MNCKRKGMITAALILELGMITTFYGCSSSDPKEQETQANESDISKESTQEEDSTEMLEKNQEQNKEGERETETALEDQAMDLAQILNADEMFSERDKEIGYEESTAVHITLKDHLSECSSGLVDISDNVITIKGEGTFLLSGSLSDGQVVVDAEKTDKIQLVFCGIDINCNTTAPLYVRQADKVFITLEQETENRLSNEKEFTVEDDGTNIDAVIFSKDDLTVNGNGSLAIHSVDHGVVSKDDLVITGGNFQIQSSDHAINGKESVRIANGNFELNTQEDAIHAKDKDDSSLGFVYISGGDFHIDAGDDGIHAASALVIDGGTITIANCYEGIEGQKIEVLSGNISLTASDDGMNAAGGNDGSGFGAGDAFATDNNCYIKISGGTLHINAEGDGIDSNGSLYITGGETYVSGPVNRGNGAVDYNGEAEITGGIFVGVSAGGMEQNFGNDSTQGSILVNASAAKSDQIILQDNDGNEILSFTPEKTYNAIIISSPEIKEGGQYKVLMGTESIDVEMSGLIYGSGSGMGGGHGGGGMGGHRDMEDHKGMYGHGNGGRPDRNEIEQNNIV